MVDLFEALRMGRNYEFNMEASRYLNMETVVNLTVSIP
jgi:hypothetical protein